MKIGRWPTMQSSADLGAALTQGALDRLEDEIDADVCAYVGLYRLRWGDQRSAVLGSLTDGYIVTPLDHERLIRYRAIRDAGGFGVGLVHRTGPS